MGLIAGIVIAALFVLAVWMGQPVIKRTATLSKPLVVGGQYALRSNDYDGSGWLSISSAPRDGTIIETKNSYGVAPTYRLSKWSDLITWDNGTTSHDEPSWKDAKDSRSSVNCEGPWLQWRPYVGDVDKYIDPTNGLQDDSAYWRAAVAATHGLSLDAFEDIAASNAKKYGAVAAKTE